jgi:hypothetical protein
MPAPSRTGTRADTRNVRNQVSRRIEIRPCNPPHEALLHLIFPIEVDTRRVTQRIARDACGEVPVKVRRRATGQVTHASRLGRAATLHRLGLRGHRPLDVAVAELLRRVVLVIDHQVQYRLWTEELAGGPENS